MTKIKYRFKEGTILAYRKKGDIYMLYETASPIISSTLILSNVETVQLKGGVLSMHSSESKTPAIMHPSKDFEQLFFYVKEVVFLPEVGLAILYFNKE